jgi:hypothetical protein
MSEAFKPVKPLKDQSVYRRSLYTQWRRTGPPPAMVAFDAPRRQVCTAKRERTDSPLQALVLLNGTQYVEAARVAAQSLFQENQGNLDKMIDVACLRCLSRRPDDVERSILQRLYREQLDHYRTHPDEGKKLLAIGNAPWSESLPTADLAATTVLMQVLMNHDFCVVKR